MGSYRASSGSREGAAGYPASSGSLRRNEQDANAGAPQDDDFDDYDDDDLDDQRFVLPLHSTTTSAGGSGGLMTPSMMGGTGGGGTGYYGQPPQAPQQQQQQQQHLGAPAYSQHHQQRHSMHGAFPSSSSYPFEVAQQQQQQQQQQYGMMMPPPLPSAQQQQQQRQQASYGGSPAGAAFVSPAYASSSSSSLHAGGSSLSGSGSGLNNAPASHSLVDSLARSASLGGRRKEPAKHDIERGYGLGYGVAYGDPALAFAGVGVGGAAAGGSQGGGGGGGARYRDDVEQLDAVAAQDVEYGNVSGTAAGGPSRGRARGWSQVDPLAQQGNDLAPRQQHQQQPPQTATSSTTSSQHQHAVGGYGDPPAVLHSQPYSGGATGASTHPRRPSGTASSMPRMSFSSSSAASATQAGRNPYGVSSSSHHAPGATSSLHQGISPTASRMSVNSSTSPSWLPPPPSASGAASARPLRESSSFEASSSTTTPHSTHRIPPLSSPSNSLAAGRMSSSAAAAAKAASPSRPIGSTYGPGPYSPSSAQGAPRMHSQPSLSPSATAMSTSTSSYITSKVSPMEYSPSAGSQNLPLLPPQLALQTSGPRGGGPPQALRSRSSQQLDFAGYRANTAAVAGGANRATSSASTSALPTGGQENIDPAGMSRGGLLPPVAMEDKRRRPKLRPVRDPAKDLTPVLDASGFGRRADPDTPGQFLSPLKCLTSHLAQTYSICNPAFQYEVTHNPRRVLTKPSKPCHNGGSDNEDYDYILYVNDVLTSDNGTGDKYLILDVLGQGTFGQVVKCQNTRTHEIVAVKVVKNKPAYFNQSMMEVAILQLLNTEHDKNDEHHLLRMLDSFIHHKHLCIVFECLASNLYELIKHNQFRGLSLQLVKMFTQQLLDALAVLKSARLIHCDLKPENILLKSLNSPQIKIIDFGSACHERQTVYTYIQSRFYRSPEVLLGLPYSTAIDMWSLGCIVVELFLGLPLFPGTSEYNQLSRIVDMLGPPPLHLLEVGKQVPEFFNVVGVDDTGRKRYRLKTMDQYAVEHGTNEQPSKQYFKASKLPDIIRTYAMPKKITRQADIDKEMHFRASFIDFVQGLLDLDPIKRWSPQQAKLHPFITGEPFHGSWQPPLATSASSSRRSSQAPVPDMAQASSTTRSSASSHRQYASMSHGARAPYSGESSASVQKDVHGGAPPGQRQAYPNVPFNNPFQPPPQGSNGHVPQQPYQPAQQHQIVVPPPPPTAAAIQQHVRMPSLGVTSGGMRAHPAQPRIPSINSSGHVVAGPATATAARGDYQTYYGGEAAYTYAQPPPPPPPQDPYANSSSSQQRRTSNYGITSGASGGGRNRANTINQMDVIPPALARLTHLGPQDPAGTRSALTPILNRDEAIREWERRQNAIQMGHHKRPSMAYPGNPQLEYLQEQAEMMGYGSEWAAQHHHHHQQQQQRQQAYPAGGSYHLSPSSGPYAATMQPPPPAVVDAYESHHRRRSGGGAGGTSHHRSALSGDFGMLDVSPGGGGGSSGGGGSVSTPVSPRRYGLAPPPPAATTAQDPHAIGHHEYMRHHPQQQQQQQLQYLPSSSMSSPAMPTHGFSGASNSTPSSASSSSASYQQGGTASSPHAAFSQHHPPTHAQQQQQQHHMAPLLPPPAVHQQQLQHHRALSDASTIHPYSQPHRR